MVKNKLKLALGGEAGDGVFSTSDVIALSYARGGLEVFTTQLYSSRIRGGHINASVRVDENKLTSHGDEIDLIKHQLGIETHRLTCYSGQQFTPKMVCERIKEVLN